MCCPYCEEELECIDYWGQGNPFREDFKKRGDIFKCENEDCVSYQQTFFTDNKGQGGTSDELIEGYPC